MVLNAIAVLCAASAWLVSRRAPQHRPVAVALSLCAALDITRAALPLPARVDLALCLAAPAASGWLYASAWRGMRALSWVIVWSMWALVAWKAPYAAWEWILPTAYGSVIVYTMSVVVKWRSERWPGAWTVTQRTAAMLLAGDVAGLVMLDRREWISYQAGAVLALVTGYQVYWLWRSRDGKCRIGRD